MQAAWTEASQRACTTGRVVCSTPGCARLLYADGRCSDHWEPPPVVTCGHDSDGLIVCGRCARHVCFDCYGPWNALACGACRARVA